VLILGALIVSSSLYTFCRFYCIFEVFLTVRVFVQNVIFLIFLRAAASVVLSLPFLFVNCNFLYVNFSMPMGKLNDDDDDDDDVLSTVVFHPAAARPAIPSVNSRPSFVSGRSLNVLELSAR